MGPPATDRRGHRGALGWLMLACAVSVPLLLLSMLGVHVHASACSGATSRPGVATREALWALALVADFSGLALSGAGLWLRRKGSVRALAGFALGLVVVLVLGAAVDPCGLA